VWGLRALACIALAFAVLLASQLAARMALAAGGEGNHPPVIDEGSLRIEGPEVVGGAVCGLVGETISGSLKVSDPDGDEVNVTVTFVLVDEWAELLGASEEERVHSITADLVEPAPPSGPMSYEFVANTSGWLPGVYDLIIEASDEEGAKDALKLERILNLRMEVSPPEASRAWIGAGLVLLACLVIVMAFGFFKAVRRAGEKAERLPPVFY